MAHHSSTRRKHLAYLLPHRTPSPNTDAEVVDASIGDGEGEEARHVSVSPSSLSSSRAAADAAAFLRAFDQPAAAAASAAPFARESSSGGAGAGQVAHSHFAASDEAEVEALFRDDVDEEEEEEQRHSFAAESGEDDATLRDSHQLESDAPDLNASDAHLRLSLDEASNEKGSGAAAVANGSNKEDSSSGISSGWMRVLSWTSLLVAVFSMSSVGPMFMYLVKAGIAPLCSVFWRQTVLLVFLLPPTLLEHYRTPLAERAWWRKRVSDRTPEEEAEAARKKEARARRRATFSPETPRSPSGSTLVHVGGADGCGAEAESESEDEDSGRGKHPMWSMFIVSFAWTTSLALWFTTAARSSLFSSLYPLVIIAYMRLWRGVRVSAGELAGVLLCLVGVVVSEAMAGLDPDTHTIAAQQAMGAAAGNGTTAAEGSESRATNTSPLSAWTDGFSVSQLQVFGDVTCIVASLFVALDVVTTSPTRRVVPLFAFTFVTSLYTWLGLLVSTLALEGTSLGMHPVHGLFGWMADGEMALRIILFGLLVGMIGLVGFNLAVKFVHPIVFSSVQLLDPGLAGMMSALFGVEPWPSASTYIGFAVVTLGIFTVVLFQARRERMQKQQTSGYQQVEMQELEHVN